MTDSSSSGPSTQDSPTPDPPPPASPAPDLPAPEDGPAPGAAARRPLGLTRFTIEGRRAPGLFVVGWLAIVAAIGLGSIGLFGASGVAGAILWFLAFVAATVGLLLLGGSETLERRAAGAAYAGPSPMLVLVAAITATQVAGFAVGLPLSAIGESIPRPVAQLIGALVTALAFIGVVRVLVVGAGALTWREMGLGPVPGGALRALLGGAVFAGPVILVTSVVAVVAVQIAGVAPESPLPPTGTALGLTLHLLAGAIVAPVAEEILFRGFALTAWWRLVGTRAAIVRTTLVFVLAHLLSVGGTTFQEGAGMAFVGGVSRIPVAVALGWLFVRTGSLWGPIGLHAAYNGILIVIGETAAAAGS